MQSTHSSDGIHRNPGATLASLPASTVRSDIDIIISIANAFRAGGGPPHPFCCMFLVSGCPGVAPIWELVEGAKNPNDNAVMMPFGRLIERLMSYDPSRGCCGVQGPVSFAAGGVPQHEAGVPGHWCYTTALFMLYVCECWEKLSEPARTMLTDPSCSLGGVLDLWRMEGVRRARALFCGGEASPA